MKKLTIKQEIHPILLELVYFINDYIDSEKFKSIAKSFIRKKIIDIQHSKNEQEIIDILDKFSFYNYDIYDRSDITHSELLTFIIYLSNIKGELLDGLNGGNKGLLEEQVSPPLSAYKYVGNNKMDITYSTRSYGLLFE